MSNIHQANAQANGWEFEYAAALFLFLKYSHLIKEIGVEKDEDIRIIKNNGHFIVAQAKSSLEIKDIFKTSHYQEVYKALRSLSETGLNDIDKYIIITNHRNPFGTDSYLNFLSDDEQEYKIIEFPDQVITKLCDYCTKEGIELDFEKVFYQFVKFQGENPTEYVKKVLTSRLVNISKAAENRADIILSKLLNFFRNNAKNKTGGIDKNELLGAIYSCVVYNSLDIQDISKASGVDVGITDTGILDEINSFFIDNSSSLATYSLISCGFIDYCTQTGLLRNKNETLQLYISSLKDVKIPSYFSSYFGETEYDLLKLYKLFISYVCIKNTLIEKVRKAFCNENI